MNTIVNFGIPTKVMEPLLPCDPTRGKSTTLKITGVSIWQVDQVAVSSPVYGVGMALDCLQELSDKGQLRRGDRVVFVGSMGSLSRDIARGDMVFPDPCICAYFGFDELELKQDAHLRDGLARYLQDRGTRTKSYIHGSSCAVYDPHMDHEKYRHARYDANVQGVDCGEAFVGLWFASRHGMRAAIVLYCSDDPDRRISEVDQGDFEKRAAESDRLMNEAAYSVLV